MYKIKRFSQIIEQKEFAVKWMVDKIGRLLDSSKIPNGAVVIDPEYYPNNVGWTDGTGKLVTTFVVRDYDDDTVLNSDINKLTSICRKRFNISVDDIKRGFAFIDDDERLVKKKSYKKSDLVWNKWHQRTHYLQKFQDMVGMDALVYSKDLDEEDRLTYIIYRPELIDGVMTCEVELSRAYKHSFENETYDEGDTSSNQMRDLFGDLLGSIRDKMPDSIIRNLRKGIIRK